MSNKSSKYLGRDFWLFRSGQIISVIGDATADIAMAWWILEKSGSSSTMGSILAIAMFSKTVILPFVGPIGDMVTRKWLIVISDVWRCFITAALLFLVYSGLFNLGIILALYVASSLGSSLFNAVSPSIVPQLVKTEMIPTAVRQTQAIQAASGVVSWLVGGLVVSIIGVYGALLINALSFIVAAVSAALIKSDTRPTKYHENSIQLGIKLWGKNLLDGVNAMRSAPVLLGIAVVAMSLNFFLTPLAVVLPALAKIGLSQPPWFLGALEGAAGSGAILGATYSGYFVRKFSAQITVVFGICLAGFATLFIGIVPGIIAPIFMMTFSGIGLSFVNTPLMIQLAIVVPENFRSRVSSLIGFICQFAAPLGIATAGTLVEGVGLNKTFIMMGSGVLLLAPSFILIPGISYFFRMEKSFKF